MRNKASMVEYIGSTRKHNVAFLPRTVGTVDVSAGKRMTVQHSYAVRGKG